MTLHGLRFHRVRALLVLRTIAWLLQAVPLGHQGWKTGAALAATVALGTGVACRFAEQRARAVFLQEWVQVGVPQRL